MNRLFHSPKFVISGLFALLGSCLTGCGSRTTHPPTHAYVGIDTSRSWQPYLAASAAGTAHGIVSNLDPDRDRLSAYHVDHSCTEFFDGLAPESADAFQDQLVGELAQMPPRSGTRPAAFWEAVADACAADKTGERTVIVLFSDGDNDDETAESDERIRWAARRLAADPRVAGVAILGASPDNWAVLKSQFAPLGQRFRLCSPRGLTVDAVVQATER